MEKDKSNKFLINIVELFDRVLPFNKEDGIYKNDIDNLYPNRIEITEKNSTTANSCSNKLGQYIYGKGFANNSTSVKNKKGEPITSNDCLQLVVNSIKTHRGAFIHLNYDFENKVNYFDVLDYKKCRISKEDMHGYSGNIIYKDWNQKTSNFSVSKKKDLFFYPYNPLNVNAQRKVDSPKSEQVEELIRNYRGQVLFLSLDNSNVYPYAWLSGQSVYDADSEFRLALYRNGSIRKGFQDKTMFIANGMDKETGIAFDKEVQKWLGAENAGSVFVFKTQEFLENPEKVIVPIQLKSSYDSKKFELDEKAFENSIRKSYLQIPKILINDNDGGIFGTSGEALQEAQRIYSNETAFIREKISETFGRIFGIENSILPLIESTVTTLDNADQIRLKSQAELKSTVGGVTKLIELQQSVSQGFTDKNSAITIVEEFYGISEELASEMIGDPKSIEQITPIENV
jgi:hypothetical protein